MNAFESSLTVGILQYIFFIFMNVFVNFWQMIHNFNVWCFYLIKKYINFQLCIESSSFSASNLPSIFSVLFKCVTSACILSYPNTKSTNTCEHQRSNTARDSYSLLICESSNIFCLLSIRLLPRLLHVEEEENVLRNLFCRSRVSTKFQRSILTRKYYQDLFLFYFFEMGHRD